MNENKAIKQNKIDENIHTCFSTQLDYLKLTHTFNFPVYSQNVHVHIVDMSSARQVWEFAQRFSQNNTLHVLVGNYRYVVAHLQ